MGKNGRREKNRARLCIVYIFIYIYISIRLCISVSLYICLFYNGCTRIYIEKFFQPSQLRNLMIGGLQGKEWKFIQKYLKENISRGVGKNRGKFAPCMGCANVVRVLCEFRTSFAQAEGVVRISRCCANFAQAWSSYLPKAISSSFQLQIVHGLKRWIFDFLSFEMVYSMQKMDFGKCSKSAKEDCSCCPLFSSFSLCFSLLLSFAWLVLMIQKAVKTLKLAINMIRSHFQVLNMPIGIKMENYYTKVLKRY